MIDYNMETNKWVVISLSVLIFCLLVFTGGVVAQENTTDTERLLIDFTIDEETGDAEVVIENRVLIETNEDEEAFTELEQDIANNPDEYITDFSQNVESTVQSAEQDTNRNMSADSFNVETDRQSLARDYGIVRYTFTWTNFAVINTDDEGTTTQAGDALDGFFLDEDTVLRISMSNEEYDVTSVSPEPSSTNPVTWTGEQTFSAGEPRVTFELMVDSGGGDTTNTENGDGNSDSESGLLDNTTVVSSLLVIFGIIALGVGIGLYIYYKFKKKQANTDIEKQIDSDNNTRSNGSNENEAGETLLSNEEQVIRVLYENDGRIKQQEMKSVLDWSDSKTSKVLKKMREADEVYTFTIGRENVVVTPQEYKNDEMLRSNKKDYDEN